MYFITKALIPVFKYKNTRQRLLQIIISICLLSISLVSFANVPVIMAVRIWPASSYTRITLESNISLKYRTFILRNPERLVLDIKNIRFNSILNQLSKKVRPEDPYIGQVRVSQYNTETVRLVLELKQKISPQFLSLAPVHNFYYRLVLDLYPYQNRYSTVQDELLLALLENYNKVNSVNTLSAESIVLRSDKKIRHNRPIVVMLDPGHGGEDPGAIGKYKTREKDIVLQIAKRLSSLIKHEPNMKVYMTRSEDIFIPLEVRVAKARKQRADLFVSIHADAFIHRTAHGASVFALSTQGATSVAAKYLAQTQNAVDDIGGVSKSGDLYLDHTIFDLIQTATINDSLKFGNHVLKHVSKITQLHKKSVDQAGFAVLKAPDIPSILVETAFISNLKEERWLRNAHYQQKMAEAILAGIKSYFATK